MATLGRSWHPTRSWEGEEDLCWFRPQIFCVAGKATSAKGCKQQRLLCGKSSQPACRELPGYFDHWCPRCLVAPFFAFALARQRPFSVQILRWLLVDWQDFHQAGRLLHARLLSDPAFASRIVSTTPRWMSLPDRGAWENTAPPLGNDTGVGCVAPMDTSSTPTPPPLCLAAVTLCSPCSIVFCGCFSRTPTVAGVRLFSGLASRGLGVRFLSVIDYVFSLTPAVAGVRSSSLLFLRALQPPPLFAFSVSFVL